MSFTNRNTPTGTTAQSQPKWTMSYRHDDIQRQSKKGMLWSMAVLVVIYMINACFLGVERANRELLQLSTSSIYEFNNRYQYLDDRNIAAVKAYEKQKPRRIPSLIDNNDNDNDNRQRGVLFPSMEETCQNVKPIPALLGMPVKNWTIVLSTNYAFVDFFENWWYFFQALSIDDDQATVLVLAEDDLAHDKLLNLTATTTSSRDENSQPSFTVVRTEYNATWHAGNSPSIKNEGHTYGSHLYQKLMVTRPSQFLKVACSLSSSSSSPPHGLIFADVDSVWKKNPLPTLQDHLFSSQNDFDLVAQVDNTLHHQPTVGYCAGFLAMKVNDATRYLLKEWDMVVMERWQSGQLSQGGDQDVLQELLVSPSMAGLRHIGLPLTLFPPGHLYFNSTTTEDERSKAMVVHNNWIHGRRQKEKRFQSHGLWKVEGRDRVSASDPRYEIKKRLQQRARIPTSTGTTSEEVVSGV